MRARLKKRQREESKRKDNAETQRALRSAEKTEIRSAVLRGKDGGGEYL
jgi:hypothetical protein